MNFTEIDMSVWNRTELFRYDIDRLRIVMSLTVDIDMTPLPELIDRKNLKISPTMMWVVSKTVNRVNFTLTNTEQTFSPADGQYVAELQFTASKTEPDFYAVMNNISLSGMGFENLEVIPTEDTAVPFSGAVLPAQDGECEEMTWLLRITFSAQSGTTLTPTLTIDYTSGVKAEAANRRLFEAPLTFIIEE